MEVTIGIIAVILAMGFIFMSLTNHTRKHAFGKVLAICDTLVNACILAIMNPRAQGTWDVIIVLYVVTFFLFFAASIWDYHHRHYRYF